MRPGCWIRRTSILKLLLIGSCVIGPYGVSNASATGKILHVIVEDAITPVTSRHIVDAIGAAERTDASAVVVQIDTPGGLDTSMRQAIKAILNSRVPVIVWVGPPGARAASAGMFLTLAAHVAAMAPGTNIGAAHPVGIGGAGSPDSTMEGKIVNDAVAYARSIAETRDRNVEWAERAVRESVSIEAEEAVRLGVCDLIAPDLIRLMDEVDGRVVVTSAGIETLSVAGQPVVEFRMTWQDRILAVITNPNIAYLLFLAGILGIFFELSNPGSIFPGVIGGISMILALFAFQSLSVNFAGVLLMLLALVLFLLEIKVPSSGALSIGGVISLLFGSLMLFRSASGGPSVSIAVIIPALIVTAGFFLFAVTMALRAQRRRISTGSEGLVGEMAKVIQAIDPEGKVFLHGEVWGARSTTSIPVGCRVRVVSVHGLELKVVPVDDETTTKED